MLRGLLPASWSLARVGWGSRSPPSLTGSASARPPALAKVVTTMDETEEIAGPVVVPLPREIDLTNAESVTRDLDAAFAPGVRVVIGDLTSTTFCDSAGIRALALAHQHAVDSKVQLRLALQSGGTVWRVLEIMDLMAVLAIYPSVEAAQSGPGRPA